MHDGDLRSAILRRLERAYEDDPTVRIVEEMGVWSGTVRIDIAVINGELSGYEIKSDRDTLKRLPNQAEIYSRVFDRVDLVVGEKHFKKASTMIPAWWGITTATMVNGTVQLTDERLSLQNPSRDPLLISQLLWKEEALAVLAENDLAAGWKSKRVNAIHRHLASALPIGELCENVRNKLKVRHSLSRKVSSNFLNVSVDADLHPSL